MGFTFDDEEMDLSVGDESPTPEDESSNRTFLIAAGVLGGIVLLSMACLAIYVLFIQPSRSQQRANQQATAEAANLQGTQVADSLTATAEAALWTATPQPSPIFTATVEPTATPVVAVATSTQVVAGTQDPAATATIAAAQTQAALLALTPAAAATGLPQTGFMDEVGLPGMLVLGAVLIVVIVLARRLRASPVR